MIGADVGTIPQEGASDAASQRESRLPDAKSPIEKIPAPDPAERA